MSDPVFFRSERGLTLTQILTLTGATPAGPVDPNLTIAGVAPLDAAGPADLSFLDNPHYAGQLASSRAGVVLTGERFRSRLPADKPVLIAAEPYRAFAQVAAALFPAAMRPGSFFGAAGIAPGASVHPEARIESGVTIDPGAVVGPGAEIGTGTVIAAHAVIGPGVRIGRQCSVGPNATVQNALVGNRVIIHPGAQIGQDGFGFAMSARGHLKVVQIGRVVIQDDVEIGACTTIDRGANRDTVVGEGTKIDNQVQIAHNVTIGRHCVIVAKTGIAGSAVLEDFVVMGGASSVVGHVRIGRGAQIAGAASVKDDVPPGARMGGTPARPLREWARELAAVKRLAAAGPRSGDARAPDAQGRNAEDQKTDD